MESTYNKIYRYTRITMKINMGKKKQAISYRFMEDRGRGGGAAENGTHKF